MLQIEAEPCPPANERCDSRINSLLEAVGKLHKVSLFGARLQQQPPSLSEGLYFGSTPKTRAAHLFVLLVWA